MPIKYRCQTCRQLLSVSRKQSGKEFPCPTCGAVTRVPRLPSETPQAEAPPQVPPSSPPQLPPNEVADAPIDELLQSPGPLQFVLPDDDSLPPTETPSGPVPLEIPQAESPAPPPKPRSAAPEPPAFVIKRKMHSDDGMDLTPMVDVTFLLLIFFMITASFSLQKTLEYPKPNPKDKGARQTLTIENLQNDSIMIRIDDRNGITVDESPIAEPALLAEQLTQLRFSSRRTSVAIDAHKDALHETVVSVIDASNAAGMENIKLISRTSGK